MNYADNEGRTALFEPALHYFGGFNYNEHVEAVKLLIAAGVDVNHIANDGSTALSFNTAALQTATQRVQDAVEEEEVFVVDYFKRDMAIFTEIVALINERIAQLAELAKQAAAEAAAAAAAAVAQVTAAVTSEDSAAKAKAKGGRETGKRKR